MHTLSLSHRQHASCFAMTELVFLINKTNGRLLFEDLLRNRVNKKFIEKCLNKEIENEKIDDD